MPELSQIVQFKYGLKSSYTSILEKDPGTLYFCTDTGEIFVGDTPFSPEIIKTVPEDSLPENTNTVVNVSVLSEIMQANYNSLSAAVNTAITNATSGRLVPEAPDMAPNGSYAVTANGVWDAQKIVGTDYSTNRLRGISILNNAAEADSAEIPEGCFAAILSL